MTRSASPVLAAFVLVIAGAAHAGAQPTDQPERPTARSESFLDVTVDVFGAADRALQADDPVRERTFWGGNSQLAYEKTSGGFSFGADASASVRRLSNVTAGTLPSYSTALRMEGPVTRRMTWDVTQGFSYGPTNAVPFFAPGEGSVEGVQTVPLVDYRLTDANRFTSTTQGEFGYGISRRGTLSALVGFEYANAPPTSPLTDDGDADAGDVPTVPTEETSSASFRRWEIGGRYTHRMTRYTNWYAGYGLIENGVIDADTIVAAPRMHNIDVGLSYGRPLSFSRRTRVAALVGSSIVQDRRSATRHWRLNGNANLRHELGRTWLARIGYYRDTQYLPAFLEPVNSDAVMVGLGGNLSTKASVSLLANYAKGRVGFAGDSASASQDNRYTIASTAASFRYALFTPLAVYAEYFLFDADFERDVALADARLAGSRRHGVRFGFSIGTGLWGNRRRAPVDPDEERTR